MLKARKDEQSARIIEGALSKWLRISRHYRAFILLIWLIMAAIGGALAATLLGINTDTSEMISSDAPYRQDEMAFEAAFSQFNDEVLVIIRADSPDAVDVFTQDLAKKLNNSNYVKGLFNAELDTFFQKNGLLFLDLDALETTLAQLTEAAPLIERLTLDPTLPVFFEALVQAAEQDNDNAERIFAAVTKTLKANLNGQSQALSWRLAFIDDLEPPYQRILTLNPVLDTSRLRPAAALQDAIDQAVIDTQELTGVSAQIYVTGNPVLRSDELQSVSRGIGCAFLISFILVGLLLLWALRSPILAIFTLISLAISIMITAGIAALIFQELNLVSVAFTVLMVGLGVDFAIHLMLHIDHERARGKTIPAAFYRTTRLIGTALVLTAPSTALAFLAFSPTKFVGMSQLGVIAAIGVIVAFLVATSFLPAIYSYIKPSKRMITTSQNIATTARFNLSNHMRNSLAIGVIILGVAAIFVLPSAKFDADPMALRSRTAPSVAAFNLLFDAPETTPYRLNYLAANEGFAQMAAAKFEAVESVKTARILDSFVPKDQIDKLELIDYAAIGLEFAVSGEGEPYPVLPNPTARLIEALSLRQDVASKTLHETLIKWQEAVSSDSALIKRSETDILFFWPHELARLRLQIQAREVTRDNLPQSLKERYVTDSALSRIEIVPRQDLRDADLRRAFIKDVKSVAKTLDSVSISKVGAVDIHASKSSNLTHISGSARTVQEAGDIIQAAMLKAIFAALIMVSLLLYLVVRSVKLVIIMLIPLGLAGALTTATGVIFGLPYNFANVIVLPLLIGIGVDSSLHLVMQSRQIGGKMSQKPSQMTVFDTVTPRAVLFSGFTTIASFGSLTFSEHRGTSSMGALLCIAIIWVIICTIFVTPFLMKWFDRPKF